MTLSVVGILESVHIADVASSFASHAVQAVRFPFPANGEVRSLCHIQSRYGMQEGHHI